MQAFSTDLHDPEGPVLLSDGHWLVTEMGTDRGCVTELDANGKRVRTVAQTGRPNGLAVDRAGIIWVAESVEPRLIALDRNGETLGTWFGPKDAPFLWPNDLCFGPDGLLYMTDSGIRFDEFSPDGIVRPEEMGRKRELVKQLATGRLFRFNPATQELVCVVDGLHFPNGIAFGPDDDLFVAETVTGDILRFRITETGVERVGRHTNVIVEDAPGAWVGPDGMAFDVEGNLYTCVLGIGKVVIADASGTVIKRLDAGGAICTNVAFGPQGSKTLYITEDVTGRLVRREALADGAVLYDGAAVGS